MEHQFVLDSKDVENTKKHAIEQALETIAEMDRSIWCRGTIWTRQGRTEYWFNSGCQEPERQEGTHREDGPWQFSIVDDEENVDENGIKGRIPSGDLLLFR